jgi:hypothetical protein
MDAEMTAFAADVLESIKQAKRGEAAQIHTLEAPKTPNEITDEFEIKRLDIQPRSIDLGDSTND